MQCPKDRKIALVEGVLSKQLNVKACPDCKGTWIPSEDYQTWQRQRSHPTTAAELVPAILDVEFVQSPFDAKASLCPECRSYLARTKIGMKTPFYVERCPSCGGIWCDRGEWDALEKMGLHTAIEQLFTSEWQSLSREREHFAQEKQATVEKLGEDLANQVFLLAEALERNPNGDFGVAYLMRRFENIVKAQKARAIKDLQ